MSAIMIDVQGQFSLHKFVERIRNYYDANGLYEGVEASVGVGGQSKQETEDKHNFIKTVL